MRITCPDCGFTRNVPDDKVPVASAVATCPKCKCRFRFRGFEDGDEAVARAGDPPVPEPRLPGEGEDGYPAGPASGAFGTGPGTLGRRRTAAPQGHWSDPDAPSRVPSPACPPEAASPAGTRRVFPPPSAHWEPAAPPEPVESEETPDQSPPVAAPPGPSAGAEHARDRLSVDVRDVGPPRREARPEKESGPGHNGVRDIWARLQAMDDEDQPRSVLPRPAREAGPHPDAPPGGEAGAPADAVPDTPPRSGEADDEPDARAGGLPGRRSDVVSGPSPDAADSPGSRSAADQDRGEVPWERLDVYGFFPGLLLTLKRILFQPVEFFESMPPGRGRGKAMVFNLVLSEFLLVIDFLWGLLGVRAKIADTGQTDSLAAMAGLPGIGFLILLIMVPLFMVAGIYLDAGLTHLLLMLLRGNGKGFDETFRAMCYSAAPTVLSAVPVAGQILSPVLLIWYMTLQAIGLKKVHGAAYSQALAVVLIKWSLYLFSFLGVLHGLSGSG